MSKNPFSKQSSLGEEFAYQVVEEYHKHGWRLMGYVQTSGYVDKRTKGYKYVIENGLMNKDYTNKVEWVSYTVCQSPYSMARPLFMFFVRDGKGGGNE